MKFEEDFRADAGNFFCWKSRNTKLRIEPFAKERSRTFIRLFLQYIQCGNATVYKAWRGDIGGVGRGSSPCVK